MARMETLGKGASLFPPFVDEVEKRRHMQCLDGPYSWGKSAVSTALGRAHRRPLLQRNSDEKARQNENTPRVVVTFGLFTRVGACITLPFPC